MASARLLGALLLLLFAPSLGADAAPVASLESTQEFLKEHCVACHGGPEPDADLSLERVSPLTKDTTQLWQRVLKQLDTGRMPPKGEARPDQAEREAVISWLLASMQRANIEPPLSVGPLPSDGNLIDHDRLFSGHFQGPASSPPRFWRKSQPQYDSLMEQLWIIPKLRYEKAHRRTDPQWAGYGYSRPFPSLDPSHFTNYSGSVHADEAALRTLMEAGGQIAQRLMASSPSFDKQLQPPVAVGISSIRRGSPWERFKLDPPARPAEFEPFFGESKPSRIQQHAALRRIFLLLLKREPTPHDVERYGALFQRSLDKRDPLPALQGMITAVIVSPEFVFRMEVGMGPTDEHGRRMLSPTELVYAIAYALTDDGPDADLWRAAQTGKLHTREDVRREVRRILADDSIEKHRRLRFFQEFFGYHQALEVFKDKPGWVHEAQYLIRDADLLIEDILNKDRDVFAELLTTERYFVAYPKIDDPELFVAIREHTIEQTKEAIERTKARGRPIEPNKQGLYNRNWAYLQGRELIPRTVHGDRASQETSYLRIYGIDGNTFEWTPKQPIKVPGRRAGILTHPAWLVAHSSNFDNDIVGRGHWIREHLLAGNITDVPIDVDANVPDEPEKTLRERMQVTQADRCLQCHRRMDPLGLPFEIYDHYGQFREQEKVGVRKNKPRPIDPGGAIIESGDEQLDGPVVDAIDLVKKLAGSERVRQSFVRHAFRYWMGRNETLLDSPTLIAADKAYVESDGSFDALLVSLLTSDSFLYRK